MIFNPILYREFVLKLRWRSGKPILIAIASIAVLLTTFIYYLFYQWWANDSSGVSGYGIFTTSLVLQFIIVCLFGPISAANSISGEKEKQSWDSLVLTALTPLEIILGKMLARLLPILAAILLFVPSAVFGMVVSRLSSQVVHPQQAALGFLVVLVSLFFFTCSSLFISSKMRKSIFSVMLNYVWVGGALMMGTLLVSITISSISSSSNSFIEKSPLMWINPVMMFSTALMYQSNNPDSSMQLTWGIISYLAMSFFMVWRLTNNFKYYAYDNG